jgi:hypothetical protein
MYLGQSQSGGVSCVGNFQLSGSLAHAAWSKEFRRAHPERHWGGAWDASDDEIYDRWYYIPKDTLRQLIEQARALPHSDFDTNPNKSGPITAATAGTLPLETKCGQSSAFTQPEAQTWWQSVGLPPAGPHPAEPPAPPVLSPGPGSPGLSNLRDDIGLGTIALLGLGAWFFLKK